MQPINEIIRRRMQQTVCIPIYESVIYLNAWNVRHDVMQSLWDVVIEDVPFFNDRDNYDYGDV